MFFFSFFFMSFFFFLFYDVSFLMSVSFHFRHESVENVFIAWKCDCEILEHKHWAIFNCIQIPRILTQFLLPVSSRWLSFFSSLLCLSFFLFLSFLWCLFFMSVFFDFRHESVENVFIACKWNVIVKYCAMQHPLTVTCINKFSFFLFTFSYAPLLHTSWLGAWHLAPYI